ncbi:metallophosphoesterase [Paenibacillus sp. GYB004]|uniref:metallophosphoesterase n=1 Tax=Paenibacillus sp. GYB004 TaxID=2994393 RepID=UPI002F960B1D
MTSGRKRNGRKLGLLIAAGLVCLTGFFYWQNNHLVTTSIRYVHPGLPDSFDDFTLVHVSDLHNKSFGANQKRLVRATRRANPDLIVITGDLIDSKRTDIGAAMSYIEQAVALAPTYYVTGNHEKWSGVYAELSERLLEAGVVIMDDRRVELAKDGDTIELLGLKDPAFTPAISDRDLERKLAALHPSQSDSLTLLLSHRPEKLQLYANAGIDLVFAGHAHGGQFRIPFVGGLIAPDQGLFPRYTSGLHTEGDTSMIVSRGLGNSIIPVRIWNRPELVVVTLGKGEQSAK